MYFAVAKYTSSHVNFQFLSIVGIALFPGEALVELLYLLMYLDLSVSPAGKKSKQTFQRMCLDLCI